MPTQLLATKPFFVFIDGFTCKWDIEEENFIVIVTLSFVLLFSRSAVVCVCMEFSERPCISAPNTRAILRVLRVTTTDHLQSIVETLESSVETVTHV